MEILGFIQLHPYAMIAIALVVTYWPALVGALVLLVVLWLARPMAQAGQRDLGN